MLLTRQDVELLAPRGRKAVAEVAQLLEDVERPVDGRRRRVRIARPAAIDQLRPGDVAVGRLEALKGIDLSIEAGEKAALVGPNGAGKSTLLLDLNGINEPSHGTVRIGEELVDRSTVRRIRAKVGLVFQDPDDQLFSPTVFEDVSFGPLHMGVDEGEIHGRVALVTEVFPRVIVMDDGRIVADGPTSTILSDDRLLEAHGLERP